MKAEFSKEQIIELRKISLDHGWKWFVYQAEQRMVLFRYYLIILSVSLAAVVALLKEKSYVTLICIGLLGGGISFIFKQIDARIKFLINAGFDAMEDDEEFLSKATGNHQIILKKQVNKSKKSVSKIFAVFFFICMASFILLAASAFYMQFCV